MAGCVWLTDDSLLLGAGLLSIDCVLSLLCICANQELYSQLSTQDEGKLLVKAQVRILRRLHRLDKLKGLQTAVVQALPTICWQIAVVLRKHMLVQNCALEQEQE